MASQQAGMIMAANIDLGFLVREPADVYHAKGKDFLSAHALTEFRRCPLLYRKKELGLGPERDTTAYLIGRAAHTLILEGRERYQREFAVGGPINPNRQPFGSLTKAFARMGGESRASRCFPTPKPRWSSRWRRRSRGTSSRRRALRGGSCGGRRARRLRELPLPGAHRLDQLH
jgi:hypothetical protein